MAEEPATKPVKKRFPKTLTIVLAVAAAEAIVFFAVFKVCGAGPEAVHGGDSHAIEGQADDASAKTAEVSLLKGHKVPNDKSGRTWVYEFDLSILVPVDQKTRLEELAKEHAAQIKDRVSHVIRAATARMLSEDDLRTLRAQLEEGLREVTGEETAIQQILIPHFMPIPSD